MIHGNNPKNYKRHPRLLDLPPDRSDQLLRPQVAFGDAAVGKLTDRQLMEAILHKLISLEQAMDL